VSQYPALEADDGTSYLQSHLNGNTDALSRAMLVNCKTCWADPGNKCVSIAGELQAKDPRVVVIRGWYHDSRFLRSELLLGVPDLSS
jgi:hypothetical protein